MSSTRRHSPSRRRHTLGFAAAALMSALMLASCGGGSSSASGADTSATSYGGGFTPGTVQMTITDRVTITVSMPDLTGVDLNALDLAGFNALPLVTKTINIGLDANHAPKSTANFLAYLNSGAYANTVFHRVVQGFVVQGGGYTDASGTLTHITTQDPISLESRNGLSNTRGTLAMARTTDPNSATSEFYFNQANNDYQRDTSGKVIVDSTTGLPVPILNYPVTDNAGYAVFGSIMDQASMDAIDAIAQIPTDGNDQPLRDITITAIAITH